MSSGTGGFTTLRANVSEQIDGQDSARRILIKKFVKSLYAWPRALQLNSEVSSPLVFLNDVKILHAAIKILHADSSSII